MSHPAHIILRSTTTRSDGVEIALSVELPENASPQAVAERTQKLQELKEKIDQIE